MNDEPWVNSELFNGEAITGNRAGLEMLKAAIEQALDNTSGSQCHDVCTENIVVHLADKESYYNQLNLDERSVLQKLRDQLLAVTFVIWFFLLPFIAVGLMIYNTYFETVSAVA
ncbi:MULTISPECIES: hypothetical protein [unclassified Pseudoalteromonas]|uniref:hypothetical protein n=1 Tax=unclassified Pseudoalteromonas TaxID=194690 RepID=UPI002097BAE6|nr:hypothetical protein [Pseudoalteromonas sp. XMcav2-N]MCO7187199.1 hypothetical protein [Pseudoalteromonas sp. XMcav2-N]